jgi:L-aspartate oxidase
MRRIRESGAPHVWLDGRALGADTWQHRFPTILGSCRDHGIDPVTDLIPVGPAQHYASGGVRTDLDGRSSLPGLFVCGEAACTGVHGANRLASNSLLEGLVFAARIGRVLAGGLPDRRDPVGPASGPAGLLPHRSRRPLQRVMDLDAGVLRSRGSLDAAAAALVALDDGTGSQPCTEDWETTNLHAIASVLVARAADRAETRGSHWREDFPDRDDTGWRVRLVSRLDPDGSVVTRRENVTPHDSTFRPLAAR